MDAKPAAPPATFLFGDDFELDVRAYELRSAGIPLKLKPIPMKLLLLLVERRGEMITREEIVGRIWGKGVFLDTDNSINGAISKLRQVLRDDAEQPRFVQTVTGQGYRFIAPVIAAVVAPVTGVTEPAAVAEAPLSPVREDSAGSFARPRVRLIGISIVATVIVLIAAWGVYLRWFESRVPALRSGGRTMLAVLPFENLTGDAGQEYFSDGMTEEMITQLGSLNPEHMGVIARTSVMHYKHGEEKLPQIAHELGVQYVLEGSVRRDGDRVSQKRSRGLWETGWPMHTRPHQQSGGRRSLRIGKWPVQRFKDSPDHLLRALEPGDIRVRHSITEKEARDIALRQQYWTYSKFETYLRELVDAGFVEPRGVRGEPDSAR